MYVRTVDAMTDLARVRLAASGWNGGPGVNVLHYSSGTLGAWDGAAAQSTIDELHAFVNDCSMLWAPGITITFPTSLDIIDSDTGNLIGIEPVPTPVAAVASTGTGASVSRGSQVCMNLLTDMFRNGRRLQGRIFLGPVAQGQIGSDGAINLGSRQLFESKMAAMTSGVGTRLAVYSRPKGNPPSTGYYGDVVAVHCKVTPANLSSRRD